MSTYTLSWGYRPFSSLLEIPRDLFIYYTSFGQMGIDSSCLLPMFGAADCSAVSSQSLNNIKDKDGALCV